MFRKSPSYKNVTKQNVTKRDTFYLYLFPSTFYTTNYPFLATSLVNLPPSTISYILYPILYFSPPAYSPFIYPPRPQLL
jgi:hypothetical protein